MKQNLGYLAGDVRCCYFSRREGRAKNSRNFLDRPSARDHSRFPVSAILRNCQIARIGLPCYSIGYWVSRGLKWFPQEKDAKVIRWFGAWTRGEVKHCMEDLNIDTYYFSLFVVHSSRYDLIMENLLCSRRILKDHRKTNDDNDLDRYTFTSVNLNAEISHQVRAVR